MAGEEWKRGPGADPAPPRRWGGRPGEVDPVEPTPVRAPNIAGAGDDPAAMANVFRARAQDPNASDEQRAEAMVLLAAIGAMESGLGSTKNVASRVGELFTDPQGGVLSTLATGGVGSVVGGLGKEIMAAPTEIGPAAAMGAASALPGSGPAPFEVPDPIQPGPVPDLKKPPMDLPETELGLGVGRLGLSGSFSPEATAATGGLYSAGREFSDLREKYDLGADAASGLVLGSLDRKREGVRQKLGLERETAIKQASLLDTTATLMEQKELEERERLKIFKEERESLEHEWFVAEEAVKYHRMSESEVAASVGERDELMSRKWQLDTVKANSTLSSEQRSELDTVNADLENLNGKLDKASQMRGKWDFVENPGEIFAAIAMTVGSAMGAYGSSITGAPNYALQISQNRAKRIIGLQKAEIAKRGQAAGGYVNRLDMLRQKFGDESLAEDAIYKGQLDQVKVALEKMILEAKPGETEAALKMAMADIDKEVGELMVGVNAQKANVAMQATSERSNLAKARAQMQTQVNLANKAMLSQRMSASMTSGADARKLSLSGTQWKGSAFNEQSHKEAREYGSRYEQSVDAIEKLIGFRHDPTVFAAIGKKGSKTFAKAQVQLSRLINQMKAMEGMGANFTEMEKQLLVMQTMDSASDFDWVVDKLNTVRSAMDRESDIFMKYRGFSRGGQQGPSASREAT